MRKNASSLFKRIKKEIYTNKFVYTILLAILISAFFIRIYRVSDLMGFYYDQGRDGLVIWDLWHDHKPFLIGPITGLKGIFLGPFYYYLIAPFYLIGGGNPAFPAIFLSFTTVLAILMLYFLGAKMHSRFTGLLAAFIGAFSYNIFTLSRWLSNPTPMLLLSTILLWCYWEIISGEKKKTSWFWVGAVLTTGISLHFESASAVFYLPIFLVFSIWQWKKIPPIKYILFSAAMFIATLLPQIIFDLRHDNILSKNFFDLIFGEKAFRGISGFILNERLKYFWGAYSGKLFLYHGTAPIVFSTLSLAAYFAFYKKFRNQLILFIIFFLVPVVGYIFFQGNYGNIYDYYTIGYFLPMILFFSVGIGEIAKHWGGFAVVIIYLYNFISFNLPPINNYLTSTIESRPISLEVELDAVDWIFENALSQNLEFNVDVYVPPVIAHSYDYLLLWQGNKKCGSNICGLRKDANVSTLYTLFENDPPNPHRLEAWLQRQKGVGEVIEEAKFGEVTVQRRKRI